MMPCVCAEHFLLSWKCKIQRGWGRELCMLLHHNFQLFTLIQQSITFCQETKTCLPYFSASFTVTAGSGMTNYWWVTSQVQRVCSWCGCVLFLLLLSSPILSPTPTPLPACTLHQICNLSVLGVSLMEVFRTGVLVSCSISEADGKRDDGNCIHIHTADIETEFKLKLLLSRLLCFLLWIPSEAFLNAIW